MCSQCQRGEPCADILASRAAPALKRSPESAYEQAPDASHPDVVKHPKRSIHDVEFKVWHDGENWVCDWNGAAELEIASSPVSALILAEIAARKALTR